MSKSITPKHKLVIDGREVAWTGRVSGEALESYIIAYGKSLELGGANEHISKSLGYVPYPGKAQVIEQKTGKVKATWKAAMFQVW